MFAISFRRSQEPDRALHPDLVRAVFPGGTITGVPKLRCMEVIEELEPVRRGIYTGAWDTFVGAAIWIGIF